MAEPTVTAGETERSATDQPDGDRQRLRWAFETGIGIPFTTDNTVEILKNGDEIFPSMLQAIEEAHESIDFLTFVYWTGPIAERFAHTLAAKAREGLRVHVLLDAVGAQQMHAEWLHLMEDSGVAVTWFRPPVRWRIWQSDNRTHRKVLICDSRVGFTGGVGIAREWEGDARGPEEWRETHFKILGPAVDSLQGAFIDEWIEGGRDIDSYVSRKVPAAIKEGSSLIQTVKSTATVEWTDITTLLQLVVLHARARLRITTAYFVPGDALVRLLCEAARRGVDIEILTPGRYTDERLVQLASHNRYQELMDSGVRVYEYERTMLHAKIITIDDELSVIGSANFNQRSMSKDDELAMVVLDPEVTATLNRHFDEDLESSKLFNGDGWRRRSWWHRAKERATQILHPEL